MLEKYKEAVLIIFLLITVVTVTGILKLNKYFNA